MYGYVYATKNTITGSIYVGKHKSPTYDPHYYGSGKQIRAELKTYGTQAMQNQMLATADTKQELNQLEQRYVQLFKQQFGTACINIAKGGDGGDTFSDRPVNEKQEFVTKMTTINQTRCATSEFKTKIAAATSLRYTDPTERQKQSERIRKAWSDPNRKHAQSQRLTQYYATHKKDQSYLHKPCVLSLNGSELTFPSVQSLCDYLTKTYSYTPSHKTFRKLMADGAAGKPFKPFHKNKYAALAGMRIYHQQPQTD